MPRITVPLVVNYDNISRPVAMSLARDVMTLLAIDNKTPIYMTGEFEQLNQPGGAMSDGDDVRFESFRRIVVTAEDKTRDESILSQIVRQNELPPILADNALGISVRPVYVQSDVTLSFKYTCSTRQQAIKWRDEFAVRRAENRSATQHEIRYDIPIQTGVLRLLAHLYDLREKTAGYGQSFPEYFSSIQQRMISTVGARDGDLEKLLVVVPERQAQLTGWFDFDAIPKESKIDGNSTWEIQFGYRAMYNRCTHLYIVYPLMIHQSHIDKEWYTNRPRFSVEELHKRAAIGIRALDCLDGDVDMLPPPADGVRFPLYDEWIPGYRNQPSRTLPAITWMVQLDPKDPQDLMSLRQLPDITLTLEMDAYFATVYKTLTVRGGASCLFTLYEDDTPLGDAMLVIDKDLNVRSALPLDLRKAYHVRLSFPTYYPQFSKAAILEMGKQSTATLQVFQSILPTLDVEDAMTLLLDGDFLPIPYIAWFYKYLQTHGIGYADGDQAKGPGGMINTGNGTSGSLGGDNSGGLSGGGHGGTVGGTGAGGSAMSGGGNWGDGIWNRQSGNGNKYVQWLSIAAMKRQKVV